MHKILLFAMIAGSLISCSKKPAFKTPNDINKTEATVYLTDGTVKKGLLSIYLENDMSEGAVELFPDDSHTKQTLTVKQILYYTIDSNTYVPKAVDLYMMGTYHYLFLKRLTKDTDRMQLYELHQLFKSNVTGEENYFYFFSFPYFSRFEVVEINSNKVVPGFDVKMSRYVEDCPSVAEKIRSKDSRFFYTATSLRPKRERVVRNIVEAYNKCR